jgi:hypothetical protein
MSTQYGPEPDPSMSAPLLAITSRSAYSPPAVGIKSVSGNCKGVSGERAAQNDRDLGTR